LGPGNSYLNAYNFLLQGANKVILADKYPRYLETKRQKEFFQQELNFVKETYNKDSLPFVSANNSLDRRYIEFLAQEATEIEGKDRFDFIYSISVLEHIYDIADNITAMSRLLKPGGLMYHHIDMRDHYNFNVPFLFYKYRRSTWEKYLTQQGGSYTNRWRYNDFTQAFQNNNLTVLAERPQRFSLEGYTLSSDFANYTNLDIGTLDVLVQKNSQS